MERGVAGHCNPCRTVRSRPTRPLDIASSQTRLTSIPRCRLHPRLPGSDPGLSEGFVLHLTVPMHHHSAPAFPKTSARLGGIVPTLLTWRPSLLGSFRSPWARPTLAHFGHCSSGNCLRVPPSLKKTTIPQMQRS